MTRTFRLRTALGWTQARMAEHLGVGQGTVSRLENGQAETGPLRRLLDHLEASLPGDDAPATAPSSASSRAPEPEAVS